MKYLRKGLPLLLILSLLLSGCRINLPLPTQSETAPVTEAVTEPPATEPASTPPPETEPPETEPPVTEPTEPPPLNVELPEPEEGDFVRVLDYIPDIYVELRYATDNNFTGQTIYRFNELWLRYGTVKKLMSVQEALREHGIGLKIWDGFRPAAAQFDLWAVCPNPAYVANPNGGYSTHSRGNTVDLTLVEPDGTELLMPTGFDDFSAKANRNYSDVSQEAAQNARQLEQIMKENGFSSIHSEWWHFVDTQSYSAETVFQPVGDLPYTGNDGAVAFWTSDDDTQQLLCLIPAGEVFPVVALNGDYVLVEYRDTLGYVESALIQPAE